MICISNIVWSIKKYYIYIWLSVISYLYKNKDIILASVYIGKTNDQVLSKKKRLLVEGRDILNAINTMLVLTLVIKYQMSHDICYEDRFIMEKLII